MADTHPSEVQPADDRKDQPERPLPGPGLLARAGLGGALMGMANLVPGISGGTMLLAAGIFPQFVQAVADLTRLRFSRNAIILLGTILVAAVAVIGPFAGLISRLVIDHTWAMYSLFIGLTLGGVPLIWRMAAGKPASFWLGSAVGLVFMVAMAVLQIHGTGAGGANDGFLILFLAGVAAASAMVLPGISGGYLLLLLGVYVTILEGIEQLVTAARTMDFALGLPPVLQIALPVGLGILAGIAVVSNLVKYVLNHFPGPTLGLLLGLLLGAVAGLWPFQHGVEPEVGDMLKGQIITEAEGQLVYDQTGAPVEPKDYPREFFQPTPNQAAGAAGLALIGFAVTATVARLGREKRPSLADSITKK